MARFSIRYKFLLVTTVLLVFCVGAYLFMATKVFKSDKTDFVFDYNGSLVSNISSDITGMFNSVSDKVKLLAYFSRGKKLKHKMLEEILSSDSEIVFAGASNGFRQIDRSLYVDPNFIETYGLQQDYFTSGLQLQKPIPFDKIKVEGEVVWNATSKQGAPLLGFGKSVVEEDADGRPLRHFAIIAFVKADKLIKALSRSRLNEVIVTNNSGEVVAHADMDVLFSGKLQNNKIFELAKQQNVRTSVVQFTEGDEKVLGAFSRAYGGKLFVLSRVSEGTAFAAVNRLLYRSIIFAGIVITLAFLVAIWFSRSLTRPIHTLLRGMKRVSGGDLQTSIEVDSQDEISVLAGSFNVMINDLKDSRERLVEANRNLEDKVKERTLQLEKQNLAVKEAQEALLRTTRLAAVGEIAGQAAHEVLNPLTSLLSRAEKVGARLREQRSQETELLQQMKCGWDQDYKKGGFQELIRAWSAPSTLDPGKSLWEEDLQNIEQIHKNLDGEMQQLLVDSEFIVQEGERINRIVNSMRTMSTVKSELQPYSVHKLLEKSVSIMADLATQYGAAIELDFAASNEVVLLDEDEFIQSITNLLRNSFQAIAEVASEGKIKIKTTSDAEKLLVSIADNGCGIPQPLRNKLFESQFTTKEKKEGTGLGLKISRRFIRGFNGDIKLVNSDSKTGSEFAIELPLDINQSREVA